MKFFASVRQLNVSVILFFQSASVSFFHFDAPRGSRFSTRSAQGRLRTGFEGRCCDLYGALPDGQECRTLCAVIRTSSPRDVVPQRGTYRVKARPYAKATVSRFQLNIVLSVHMRCKMIASLRATATIARRCGRQYLAERLPENTPLHARFDRF
jgi:hypothetical protein